MALLLGSLLLSENGGLLRKYSQIIGEKALLSENFKVESMQSRLLFGFLSLVLFIGYVRGLHFYMKPDEVKCFYEGLREGTLLTGDIDGYIEQYDGQFIDDPRLIVGISVYEMFDNDERVLNQQNSHSGDFALTALESGEHKICIHPTYPKKDANIRIFMEFDITTSDSLDSRRKQDVKLLRERISQLMNRLQRIRAAQRSIREDEEVFRDQSESANRRILTWSVTQIIALVIVCGIQLRYLKSFFIKQKVL